MLIDKALRQAQQIGIERAGQAGIAADHNQLNAFFFARLQQRQVGYFLAAGGSRGDIRQHAASSFWRTAAKQAHVPAHAAAWPPRPFSWPW